MRWIKITVSTLLVALMAVAAVANPARASVADDFIAKLVKGAQENERRNGIPTSVTIGMAALETGWGRSSMTGQMTVDGKVYQVNTLFNIKCTSTVSPHQSGCVPVASYEYKADGTKYLEVSNFRTYASWNDSMLDYGRLLTTASRYAPAFKYTKDPDRFVEAVRAGGYATDPRYSELVIQIMRSHNLYQYNLSGADGDSGTVKTGPVVAPVFELGTDYPAFNRGSRGVGVETLQGLLNARNGAGLAIDGSYGELTEAAVKAYQSKAGRTANGRMDDATWRALVPTLKR
ncbi:MAG: glucosaminidase domain-containing protein, partial [Propionibacteriaceae bacterium]|nr:glucosaminidase domain-containing protein [Propionibacteriaceae bacterium]